MKTINIVLPVYNEEEMVADFHMELSRILDSLTDRYKFEIIYVLDKSSDNTLSVLRGIAESSDNVRVLSLSKRFGHQMSLVAGMDKCSGDAVIMMDSDLQHPPSLLPKLLAKFEDGYDIVHTVRRDTEGVSLSKKITSSIFYFFINKISATNIRPGAADFRLISKKVLHIFQNDIREQNQFLRGLFHWVGFDSAYVDYVSKKRNRGVTKYNPLRLLKFSVVGVVSFSKLPLRISAIIGFLFSVAGFIYGVILVLLYFIEGDIPQGWTSLIVVILLMGGLQLIVLGILGEYMGSMFEETKKRPLYIIEGEYGGKRE